MTDYPETRILSTDYRGTLAVNDHIVFYLTPCCQASVTGTENGIACRACYNPVDPVLGLAWMTSDDAAWDRYENDLFNAAQHKGGTGHSDDAHRIVDRIRLAADPLTVDCAWEDSDDSVLHNRWLEYHRTGV